MICAAIGDFRVARPMRIAVVAVGRPRTNNRSFLNDRAGTKATVRILCTFDRPIADANFIIDICRRLNRSTDVVATAVIDDRRMCNSSFLPELLTSTVLRFALFRKVQVIMTVQRIDGRIRMRAELLRLREVSSFSRQSAVEHALAWVLWLAAHRAGEDQNVGT